MSKPTIIQTLLKRPSQTYSFPHDKDYFSSKQDMLRIAAEGQFMTHISSERPTLRDNNAQRRFPDAGATQSPSSAASTSIHSHHSSLRRERKVVIEPSISSVVEFAGNNCLIYEQIDKSDSSDSECDIFYTPNTSPRTSMASSSLAFPLINNNPLATTPRKSSRRSLRTTSNERLASNSKPNEESSSLLSLSSAIAPAPSSFTKPLLPLAHHHNHQTSTAVPSTSTRTPLVNAKSTSTPRKPNTASASTSSFSSASLDGHSLFSDLMSESTGSATPVNSRSDLSHGSKTPPIPHGVGKSKFDNYTATSTRTPAIRPGKPVQLRIQQRQGSKVPPPQKNYTYTDDDWAKDVRWLVPPKQNNSDDDSAKSTTTPIQGKRKTQAYKMLGSGLPKGPDSVKQGKEKGKEKEVIIPEPTYYTASNGMPLPPNSNLTTAGVVKHAQTTTKKVQMQIPNTSSKNGIHTYHAPSIMMSMTALLEEDEEGPLTPKMESGSLWDSSSANGEQTTWCNHNQRQTDERANQRVRSMHTATGDVSVPMMTQDTSTVGHLRRPRTAENDDGLLGVGAASKGSSNLKHRRSRSLEHESRPVTPLSSATKTTTTSTFSSFANALPIIGSGDLPSHGTPGYTSLHLARAPPSVLNSKGTAGTVGVNLSGNGKVDLTRSGVAQTTMASVEVVKGLGMGVGKKGLFSGVFGSMGLVLGRRRTVSGGERARGRSMDEHGPSRFATVSGGIGGGNQGGGSGSNVLGFTGYRKPPGYVPSGSVLVQVWAVGVDGVDGRLVGIRMGSGPGNRDPVSGSGLEPRNAGVEDVSTPQIFQVQEKRRRWMARGREGEEEAGGGEGEGREFDKDDGDDHRHHQYDYELEEPPVRSAAGSSGLGRSVSLRSKLSLSRSGSKKRKPSERDLPCPPVQLADVGYIPGRSFVGRVLECGWEVKEEVVRKGEWVVGLLDVKKCGALTEFLVVDRRRVHRVPYPAAMSTFPSSFNTSFISLPSSNTMMPPVPLSLSLEELALLPLCGIPSYRAVRTFMYAFSTMPKTGALSRTQLISGSPAVTSVETDQLLADHELGRRRRVLVLRGHNGVGAMAVQMLALRGWRVSVHVPVSGTQESEEAQRYMADVEDRVRLLGGEEVVFDDGGSPSDPWWDDGRGAAIRVIDGLREDGDVFDSVLDTIGGKDIREASERLLRSMGGGGEPITGAKNAVVSLDGQSPMGKNEKKNGMGQFTTLVGDVPGRTIPTAGDNFRAGLRSLKLGSGGGDGGEGGSNGEEGKGNGKVGYAWVSLAQDVDWEGDDISESIGNVLRLCLDHGIRPVCGPGIGCSIVGIGPAGVVPFERTTEVFVDGGPLGDGGTMVARVVG